MKNEENGSGVKVSATERRDQIKRLVHYGKFRKYTDILEALEADCHVSVISKDITKVLKLQKDSDGYYILSDADAKAIQDADLKELIAKTMNRSCLIETEILAIPFKTNPKHSHIFAMGVTEIFSKDIIAALPIDGAVIVFSDKRDIKDTIQKAMESTLKTSKKDDKTEEGSTSSKKRLPKIKKPDTAAQKDVTDQNASGEKSND